MATFHFRKELLGFERLKAEILKGYEKFSENFLVKRLLSLVTSRRAILEEVELPQTVGESQENCVFSRLNQTD